MNDPYDALLADLLETVSALKAAKAQVQVLQAELAKANAAREAAEDQAYRLALRLDGRP